ncbi:MAG: hypothetical protein GY757_25525, partial [bacterium]|nr:hypothetical protein [bacterium]
MAEDVVISSRPIEVNGPTGLDTMKENKLLPTLPSFPFGGLVLFLFLGVLKEFPARRSLPSQFKAFYFLIGGFWVAGLLVAGFGNRAINIQQFRIPFITINSLVPILLFLISAFYTVLFMKPVSLKSIQSPAKLFWLASLVLYACLSVLLLFNSEMVFRYLLPLLFCAAHVVPIVFLTRCSSFSIPGAPTSGNGEKEKYNRLIFDKYNFSQREQEITSLVVEGKTNKV